MIHVTPSAGQCLGYIRLASIDAGTDLRATGTIVHIDGDDATAAAIATHGPDDQTGVGYDTADGRAIVRGPLPEVADHLIAAGYRVQVCHHAD